MLRSNNLHGMRLAALCTETSRGRILAISVPGGLGIQSYNPGLPRRITGAYWQRSHATRGAAFCGAAFWGSELPAGPMGPKFNELLSKLTCVAAHSNSWRRKLRFSKPGSR